MTINENILCSKSHEYVYEKDGSYYIGLTDFAIEQLGDIVFVELPEINSEYTKGESVKAASELYMPVSGKVIEINEQLIEKPELLNEEPFEEMWLIKIESENYKEDSSDLIEYNKYKEEVE